jgi:hypothetical protein
LKHDCEYELETAQDTAWEATSDSELMFILRGHNLTIPEITRTDFYKAISISNVHTKQAYHPHGN